MSDVVDRIAIQNEVDANYEAFLKELPKLRHRSGKFALMRGGRIIEFYDTVADAVSAGNSMFEDKLFSVQHVTTTPVDLGFLSHAVSSR